MSESHQSDSIGGALDNPIGFSGRNVLVTGASGFIGTRLCRRLVDSGADVNGVYLNAPNRLRPDNIRWWQCNLADRKATQYLLRQAKPDYIFHLASHVAGARSIDLVMPTFDSNLASQVNLLSAATQVGCERIVVTGSMEEPTSEATHTIPSSPYAASKWAASAYARMFHALYDAPVTIARVFMVYGPGQRDLSKLIPYTILSLHQGKVPQFTSGHRQVDWIYVEDVVGGLLAMSAVPNVNGQTVDVGSGATRSIKEIVMRLVDIMQSNIQPEFGSIPDRPMEQVRVANIDQTVVQTGWRPEFDFSLGLQQTVEWYLAHHF